MSQEQLVGARHMDARHMDARATEGRAKGLRPQDDGILGDAPFRHALIVANPIAGRGKGSKTAEELQAGLASLGVKSEVHRTLRRGDARRRVAALDDDVDLVVSVGGDGTVREVLDGLPDPDVAVGILPNGTANALAAELGLSRDVHRTLELVRRGRTRRIDVAYVGDALCTHILGIGADAMAVREVERVRSGPVRKATYAAACLKTLARYVPPRLVVEVDGESIPGEFGLVLFSSAKNYGDLLHLDPDSMIDDGLFEAYLFPASNRVQLAKVFARGLWGRLPAGSGIRRQARRLTVSTAKGSPPVPYHVDGDLRGETPVTAEVARVQYNVVCP